MFIKIIVMQLFWSESSDRLQLLLCSFLHKNLLSLKTATHEKIVSITHLFIIQSHSQLASYCQNVMYLLIDVFVTTYMYSVRSSLIEIDTISRFCGITICLSTGIFIVYSGKTYPIAYTFATAKCIHGGEPLAQH